MKWKTIRQKKTLYLIRVFFVAIFILGVGSSLLYNDSMNMASKSQTELLFNEIQSAVEHSPIYINGDAELDAFCSGNGTTGLSWATAHVIDGYELNRTDETYGVWLNQTTRHVIIKNVQMIPQFSYAMALINGSNIKIQNMYTNEGAYSIFMEGCENITITNSNFENTGYGIYMEQSQNVTISRCRFGFDGSGIVMTKPLYVLNSANITVDLCEFDDLYKPNSGDCYCSVIDSVDFAMFNSTMQSSQSMNSAPAFLQISGGSHSQVTNNSVSNTEEWGLRFLDHSDFLVLNNVIDVTDDDSIYLSGCHNGYFAHNNLSNEGILFHDTAVSENMTIDTTNLVNDQPLYYYENTSQIDESLGEIGQLILNHVNNSQISETQIGENARAIQMFGCENITFDQLNLTDFHNFGIYSNYINNFTCTNLTLDGIGYGIYSYEIDTLHVEGCNITTTGTAIYTRNAQDVFIDNNELRANSRGVNFQAADTVILTNNAFIDCSYEYNYYDVTNFSLDDSNTRNGIPMFYRTDLFNQTYNIGPKSEFHLVNCRNLIIYNLELIIGSNGIILRNCTNIQFVNFTITESEYAFVFSDCENVFMINGTLTNCDSGGELENCNNTLIQRTFFNGSTDYLISLYDCYDLNFTENGFLNFSYGIYADTCFNVSIVDNIYGNNDSVFIESEDVSNLVVEDNLEDDEYDRDSFGPLYIDPDPFGKKDNSQDPGDGTDTSTSTSTNTTTDTTDTNTDPQPTSGLDPLVIILIIAGSVLIIGSVIFLLLKNDVIQTSNNQNSTQHK